MTRRASNSLSARSCSRRDVCRRLVGLGAVWWVSALQGCRSSEGKRYSIGAFQMAPNPAADAEREGFLRALAEAGYVEGKDFSIEFRDAQGELANAQLIAQQFVSSGVDLIYAIGTPTLQSAIKAAPPTLPIVFSLASDPWGAGAGESPTQHLPNVVGTLCIDPVDAELDLIRDLVPDARRVGLIYNSGESNARYEAQLIKEAASSRGMEIVEQTVAFPVEVLQAAQSLAAKKIDAFAKIADYATIVAFDSLVKVGREARIPVFSVDEPDIEKGALATVGWSYVDDGYAAGQLAVRIRRGESPADIPFQPLTKKVVAVSLPAAASFGVTVPEAFLEKADRVVRKKPGK